MITGRYGYRDIADILRDRITSGQLRPGDRIPSEKDLQQEYGVARETARRAARELVEEGLVVTSSGYPSRVTVPPERAEVRVSRYSSWLVRPPTRQERQDLNLARGVKIVQVTTATGNVLTYPDDRYYFTNV